MPKITDEELLAEALSLEQNPARCFTPQVVARYLNISEQRLMAWRREGIGPKWFRPPGSARAVRYRGRDVMTWIRNHTQKAG